MNSNGMVNNILIKLTCFCNRNLRYDAFNIRPFRFFVIRTRTALKKFIRKNDELVNRLGKEVVKLKDAGHMELVTTDYIDKWLYTGADFEPHIKRLVLKYLNRGDHFLDIGANIGYFTLIASQKVSQSGSVVSFEPNPAIQQRLLRNIELNKRKNITVIKKALSNINGIIEFKTPVNELQNSGRSSFRNIEEEYKILEVETIKLDTMLTELPKISLVKMDIEGAEYLALNGMPLFLQRDRPKIIIELSDVFLKQMGSSAAEVLTLLDSYSYDFFIISEDLVKIEDRTVVNNMQYDVLCLPIER